MRFRFSSVSFVFQNAYTSYGIIGGGGKNKIKNIYTCAFLDGFFFPPFIFASFDTENVCRYPHATVIDRNTYHNTYIYSVARIHPYMMCVCVCVCVRIYRRAISFPTCIYNSNNICKNNTDRIKIRPDR